MSLAETQKLLARLYTDFDLRRRLSVEPETVAAEYNIAESEVVALARSISTELDEFADSLFYKRLREAEKLLPLSRKVLGKQFELLFQSFAIGFAPRSIKKHLEDAVAFADFLASQNFGLRWIRDLVLYERTRLEFNGYGKKFAVRRFRYDVLAIAEFVNNSANGFTELQTRDFSMFGTTIILLRMPNGRARQFVVKLSF